MDNIYWHKLADINIIFNIHLNIFTKKFYHIYCDSTAGHKQSRGSFKCVGDNFFIQVIEETMTRGTILDLVLTNRKKLVENVMLQGICGCSDHQMLEFEILSALERH